MTPKRIVNAMLNRLGYQIKRMPQSAPSPIYSAAQYNAVIREVYNLYRLHIFPDLPELNEERLRLLRQLLGTNISEAVYILHTLAASMPLSGDICEFGVAQGTTSALMAYEIMNTRKNIWLFDSFKGLPMPTEKDLLKDDIFNLGTIEAYKGTMACGVDMVTGELRSIDFPLTRAKVVPGFIEETIHQPNLPKEVCFAYVDFDFYEPILIALEFLDDCLAKNGYVVVDDYDWFSTGAKTAVDEFVAAHGSRWEFTLPIPGAGHFAILRKGGSAVLSSKLST
jgi:O-methyltransferase